MEDPKESDRFVQQLDNSIKERKFECCGEYNTVFSELPLKLQIRLETLFNEDYVDIGQGGSSVLEGYVYINDINQ